VPKLDGIARRTIGGSDGPLGRLRWLVENSPRSDRRGSSPVPPFRTVAGPGSGHRSRVRYTGRTTCSCAFVSSSCSPSGFRPCTFGAVLRPRPLVILRRHMGPGGDLQRVDRCTAVHACWAVLPVRGLWPAGQALQSGPRPGGPSEPPTPWTTASRVPPGSSPLLAANAYGLRSLVLCMQPVREPPWAAHVAQHHSKVA
jgi:hypothetical protein